MLGWLGRSRLFVNELIHWDVPADRSSVVNKIKNDGGGRLELKYIDTQFPRGVLVWLVGAS